MATGVPPFRGESSGVIFDAILNRAPTSPVRRNPDLPAKLEDIIERAFEKDRNLRYQHASEIRAELLRLKRDTDSTQRSGPTHGTEAGAKQREGASTSATRSLRQKAIGHRTKYILFAMLAGVLIAALAYFVPFRRLFRISQHNSETNATLQNSRVLA